MAENGQNPSAVAANGGEIIITTAPAAPNTSLGTFEADDVPLFPCGFRFLPTGQELIRDYLKKKVKGKALPPNLVHDAQVYAKHPSNLTNEYELTGGSDCWYFFSSRNKKYPNGKRPNRATEDGLGFWKPVGKDEPIFEYHEVLGYKKTLDYYEGQRRQSTGTKTAWKMHEYTLTDSYDNSQKNPKTTMTLDNWVLCKIYKSRTKVEDGDDDQNSNKYYSCLQEVNEASSMPSDDPSSTAWNNDLVTESQNSYAPSDQQVVNEAISPAAHQGINPGFGNMPHHGLFSDESEIPRYALSYQQVNEAMPPLAHQGINNPSSGYMIPPLAHQGINNPSSGYMIPPRLFPNESEIAQPSSLVRNNDTMYGDLYALSNREIVNEEIPPLAHQPVAEFAYPGRVTLPSLFSNESKIPQQSSMVRNNDFVYPPPYRQVVNGTTPMTQQGTDPRRVEGFDRSRWTTIPRHFPRQSSEIPQQSSMVYANQENPFSAIPNSYQQSLMDGNNNTVSQYQHPYAPSSQQVANEAYFTDGNSNTVSQYQHPYAPSSQQDANEAYFTDGNSNTMSQYQHPYASSSSQQDPNEAYFMGGNNNTVSYQHPYASSSSQQDPNEAYFMGGNNNTVSQYQHPYASSSSQQDANEAYLMDENNNIVSQYQHPYAASSSSSQQDANEAYFMDGKHWNASASQYLNASYFRKDVRPVIRGRSANAPEFQSWQPNPVPLESISSLLYSPSHGQIPRTQLEPNGGSNIPPNYSGSRHIQQVDNGAPSTSMAGNNVAQLHHSSATVNGVFNKEAGDSYMELKDRNSNATRSDRDQQH